jgi:UDP-N-acetylmuramoyl-tripeptide--D-alanyl-D-alanine ligase
MRINQLYEIFEQYPAITTDSRNCSAGSVFFALKGDQFDGNDYIEQALASGAVYAVGDRKKLPENERIIQVDDALQALQALAGFHRKQMKARVIAVTGTNGKTTTKELIATALSTKYKTLYTQGNLNNHIGVPLTLLRLKPDDAFAVIEMGANHPGEIRTLCRIAAPDFGLITNVGVAHMEGFGSPEGVVRTKAELYDFLRENGGTVFGNRDNQTLNVFYHSLQMIYYGQSPDAFVHGKITAFAPTLAVEWERGGEGKNKIETRLAGSYNFENVLAAVCVASYFDVESAKINTALANYFPANNRSQNQQTERNQLIIDAYNANPSSMQVALDSFDSVSDRPKVAILGEMKELGAYARS